MKKAKQDEDDIVDRLKLLLKTKKISRPKLEKLTGVSAERWASVVNRKVSVRIDEIMAICELWPMYRHWLFFGVELPESGQISPDTEMVALDYLHEAISSQDDPEFYRETILKHVPSLGWLQELNTGEEGVFVSRILGTNDFYNSDSYKKLYENEDELKVKRLNSHHKQLLKKEPKKKLELVDVMALEWLEFLTKTAIKRSKILK
ncbi:MAG: hypothetical protein CML06_15050 [Pseudomonadales bacterium]|nr:hypothetical protein [Pseudomonadales bacterium]